MNSKDLIDHFGSATIAAKKLGYADRNCIYNMPDPITPRTLASIKKRMKLKRIPVPKEWV
ncbi:MAG: hypothetical protein Q8924_12270 [Bacillota bacterium]|nr:hypothetical protein [Bacillota bacterium]